MASPAQDVYGLCQIEQMIEDEGIGTTRPGDRCRESTKLI